MALPFVDDFERPDEQLDASANWTRVVGPAATMRVVSGSAVGPAVSTPNAWAFCLVDAAAEAAPDDQYIEAPFNNLNQYDYAGLILRGSGVDAGFQGYVLRMDYGSFNPLTVKFRIDKYVAGSVVASSSNSGNYAEGLNLLIRFQIEVDVLTVLADGVPIITWNDADIAFGQWGVAYLYEDSNTTLITQVTADATAPVVIPNPEITFTGANTLKDIDGNTVNGVFRYAVFDDTGLYSTMTKSTNDAGEVDGLATITNGEVVLDLGAGSTTGSKVVFFQDDGTGQLLQPHRMEAI